MSTVKWHEGPMAALDTETTGINPAADGIAVLPGWQNSRGARAEVEIATHLGIEVRPVEAWLDGTIWHRIVDGSETEPQWHEEVGS